MRNSRLLGLVSIFCFAALQVVAQQTNSTSEPAPMSDPQAVGLIQKSLSALSGGIAIGDVTLTGMAHRIAGSDDETGTAVVTAILGGYSKISLTLPSGPRLEVRNPSAVPLPGAVPSAISPNVSQLPQPAGAWSGPDGNLQPIVGHNLLTDADWFFPAMTFANVLQQSTFVLSYAGQDSINGQAVLHVTGVQQFPPIPGGPPEIASLMRHLTQMDFYLDPTTLFPVAFTFNIHPDSNALVDIPVRIQFSGFQLADGVQMPYHIQKYLNNNLVLDFQFTNAILNSGLTASAFSL